jgi:hypothetical protein
VRVLILMVTQHFSETGEFAHTAPYAALENVASSCGLDADSPLDMARFEGCPRMTPVLCERSYRRHIGREMKKVLRSDQRMRTDYPSEDTNKDTPGGNQ